MCDYPMVKCPVCEGRGWSKLKIGGELPVNDLDYVGPEGPTWFYRERCDYCNGRGELLYSRFMRFQEIAEDFRSRFPQYFGPKP